jgi:DeoR family transcriptional regulator, suf operon transcriptional repressor
MTSGPALAGYRGTRGEILIALKKAQPLTTKELAERFDVTPNALRRHLKELESQGMVRYRREIRGVGGPVFAYSLSESGEALFPRAYDDALAQALELLREQHGIEGVVSLFRKRWEAVAADSRAELSTLPLEQRAHRLAELLTSLGYMAEFGAGSDGEATLTEHNCAIRSVAQRYPEVCAAEERFIEQLLGVAVTREAHIAAGANCCAYCIQSKADANAGSDPNFVPATGMLSENS